MCGAPVERRRSFCADHCAQAYIKIVADEDADVDAEPIEEERPEEETEDEDPEQEAAE